MTKENGLDKDFLDSILNSLESCPNPIIGNTWAAGDIKGLQKLASEPGKETLDALDLIKEFNTE